MGVLLVETVGVGGGGESIDDLEDVETGEGTGVLKLSVVEVDGDSDDGVGDFSPRKASAVLFVSPRTIAEVSSGV